MKQARNLDPTSHGGYVQTIATHTYVNGKLVAIVGSIHVCPEHGNNVFPSGSPNVYKEGQQVLRVGVDASECGGVIIEGSPDTSAN